MKNPTIKLECLSPGCSEGPVTRCLCNVHYKNNRELVETGGVTWNEIFLLMGRESAILRHKVNRHNQPKETT